VNNAIIHLYLVFSKVPGQEWIALHISTLLYTLYVSRRENTGIFEKGRFWRKDKGSMKLNPAKQDAVWSVCTEAGMLGNVQSDRD
jgi:hypothetical protein